MHTKKHPDARVRLKARCCSVQGRGLLWTEAFEDARASLLLSLPGRPPGKDGYVSLASSGARRRLRRFFSLLSRLFPVPFRCGRPRRIREVRALIRPTVHGRNRDRILPPPRTGESTTEALSGARAHLNQALGFEDFDRADVALGDPASLANEWQDPARLSSLLPPDRELEPDTAIEIAPRSRNFAGVFSCIHELFRRRAVGLVLAKERRRDLLRAFRGEQFLGEGKLFVVKRAFEGRVAQKPFPVALEDGLGARNLHPGRLYSRKG